MIEILEVHPKELFNLSYSVNATIELLSRVELECSGDEQNKKMLLKDLIEIQEHINHQLGSKTAESLSEGLIRKVFEQIFK